jgi:subfamily B ATP-binding cassette protein MsbA
MPRPRQTPTSRPLPENTSSGEASWKPVGRLLRESGRRYIGRYAIVIALLAVSAGATAMTAWLMKDVVDEIFLAKNASMLFVIAGAFLATFLIRGFASYGATVTLTKIGNEVVGNAQRRMFDHILSLGVPYHDRVHSSELITRMTSNANSARIVLDMFVTGAARDILSLIGLLAVMIIQSPLITAVILVFGPIAMFGTTRLVRRVRTVSRREFHSLGQAVAAMQESVIGIRLIKAFNLEPIMRKRMSVAIDAVRGRANRIARLSARSGPLMETIAGVAIAAIILVGGYSIIYLGEEPGSFMSVIAALLLAYDPARRLASTRVKVEAHIVGIRLMYELLDTPPTLDPKSNAPDLTVSKGEIVFENVEFAYRADTPVLRGMNLHARAGEMTALVGPSGSGKSTVIALIERFYDVGAGRITIDGQNIADVNSTSLHRASSLVSQDTVLFNDTIRENIRFGRPEATDAEVEAAARDALAHDFIVARPEGYDTLIGGEATALSGGQRQRIAIARAMLRNAPIVLLDEATSSLDTESERQVQIAFARLMAGRTTIVIAHRLSTVLGAGKICFIADGRVVEEGRHTELMALNGRYARLYRSQFEHQEDHHRPKAAPAA